MTSEWERLATTLRSDADEFEALEADVVEHVGLRGSTLLVEVGPIPVR